MAPANLGDFLWRIGQIMIPPERIDLKDKSVARIVSAAPRHGLKLVNGALGNVPTKPDATGGFTVSSENIVYIVGNYNANDAGFGDPHAAASVVADTVSFLSKNWQDWTSIADATYVGSTTKRMAVTSYYRLAVAAGKNLNWPHPTSWAGGAEDWGLDGELTISCAIWNAGAAKPSITEVLW